MTAKTLATEIETLKADGDQKRFDTQDEAIPTTRPLHQFEFNFSNQEVLFDVLKLIFSFLDRDHNNSFSTREKNKLEKFIRNFFPIMFEIDQTEFDLNLPLGENGSNREEEGEEEEETHMEEEIESEVELSDDEPREKRSGSSSSSGGMNKKGAAADLRKKLLTHATVITKSNNRKSNEVKSVGTSLKEQTWIQLSAAIELEEEVMEKRINFFTNSTFYSLIRLIQVSFLLPFFLAR